MKSVCFFQKRKIKLDRFVGEKVKISGLLYIGKQISLKIFYHQQKKNKLRLKENEIRSARCWEDGTVLSRPGVKQIKYPFKIMTAVINRHRMMTPPPVIILRRKMTLLPEECVNFHNIGTVYTKKSHPCTIKTPYICRFQYHFLLLVKLSFTMLS